MVKLKIAKTLLLIFGLALAGCKLAGNSVGPPVEVSESVKETVRESLASVQNPVTLHLFEGGEGETAGPETRALLTFMAETSPLISISTYSFDDHLHAKDYNLELGVSHGPVIRMEGVDRRSLYFYGFPERKELLSFLEGVILASGAPANLPPGAEDFLAGLQQEILIRIFTTPD